MICALAFSASAKDIQTIVNAFGKDTTFRYSSSAVSIYDIKKTKEVARYNSSIFNVPASTMKTVTCATALAVLGENFRFTTPIKLIGKQDTSGVFYGNIVVEPGCDPTLGSEHFSQTRHLKTDILRRIEDRGIKEIKGQIIVLSDGIMTDGINLNWTLDDVAWEYGATTFDFNYADNKFMLNFEVVDGELKIGETVPKVPNLRVRDEIIVAPNDSSYAMRTPDIVRGINSDELILAGTVKENTGKRRISCSVKNPAEVFVSDITEYLKMHDIVISGEENDAEGDTVMLYNCKSPKLKDIAHSALERSDNMFTQTLLLELSKKEYGVRNCNLGIKVVRKYWEDKGLNLKELRMVDGSGLARKNTITARFLSKLLAVAQKEGLGRDIDYASYLPKLGREGTVKSLLKKTKYRGRIAMKSGSMSNVQCFAGYFPAENPRYSISILVNDFLGSRRTLRKKIEAFLLEALPELERIPAKR